MDSKITKLFFLFSFIFILTSCKSECKHDENEKSISESCYPNSKKPSQVITYEEMADMMTAGVRSKLTEITGRDFKKQGFVLA